MTNAQLNAFLDEKCFGVDQTRKMCGAYNAISQCAESQYPEVDWKKGCGIQDGGGRWATCPHRKPYTPPDYCGNPVAYTDLLEWWTSNAMGSIHSHCVKRAWLVCLRAGRDDEVAADAPTQSEAFARAVYKAMKGTTCPGT